jgi:uncharacterized protein YbcC (UPF0753/DUF2309 family)
MLKGLSWLFVSFVGERQAQKDNRKEVPALSEGERVRLRSQIALAAEIIAPFWPMRTFISRNPLHGLEHLPFDEAIRRAQKLLGGEGYLSNETYRKFYRRGRMTLEEISESILTREPALISGKVIQALCRPIEPIELLRLHLIHGFDRLHPDASHLLPGNEETSRLREDLPSESRKRILERVAGDLKRLALLDADPERYYIESLWSAVLEKVKGSTSCSEKGSGPFDGETVTLPKEMTENSSAWSDLLEGDLLQVGRDRTLGEWGGKLFETDLIGEINDQMIKWCAAFLSEGAAAWPMPHRDLGFYAAWRALAIYDSSGRFIEIHDIRDRINRLPAQPEDAISFHLRRMGIGEESWKEYLERHLAQLPGWSGFIKWRADHRDYPWQQRYPADLIQYLAVRLFYESEFLDLLCRKNWEIAGNLEEMATYFRGHLDEYYARTHMEEVAVRDDPASLSNRDWSGLARRIDIKRSERERRADLPAFRDGWRLFHLAQFLELSAEEVRALSSSDLDSLLSLLDSFPPEAHRPVWQEAYEAHYRKELINRLAQNRQKRAAPPSAGSDVQAFFCIDVRQEALRRHLEARGIETFGIAGFFGVPIRFRPFHSEEDLSLCPVLIKPKHAVAEVPRSSQEKEVEKNLSGSRWLHIIDGLYHDLKMNLLSPYIIVEAVGGLFGLPFVGKTLFPRLYLKMKRFFSARLMPPVSTRLEMNLAPTEQAYYVEAALRLIGLTKNFSRLIFVCAHGSRSENNPYFASLDCGACGGNHGSPNARVLAAMANRSDVRLLLRERGIALPDETVFIAGEHNTTTDEVILFDLEDVPSSHQADLARLIQNLKEARASLSQERCTRLPGAPKRPTPDEAVSHVENRSGNWSQVRPEWGLSGNANFIIGRRSLTEGIDLQGRAFLHSYDPGQDATGKALEIIMTAPLIVGEWINMQYYFSTVDNDVYGSGTKVVHNVVGRIGVMIGNRSDLQTGLPWQTVMNGEEYYHEPMRLLAVIEAPVERVASIIKRHLILQQLFNHQWMILVVVDPASGRFHRYTPEGEWELLFPERLVSTPSIRG